MYDGLATIIYKTVNVRVVCTECTLKFYGQMWQIAYLKWEAVRVPHEIKLRWVCLTSFTAKEFRDVSLRRDLSLQRKPCFSMKGQCQRFTP